MAQQAILAAHRRQRERDGAPLGGGGPSRQHSRSQSPSIGGDLDEKVTALRQELKANADQLYQQFSIWDEDGSGAIDRRELKNMCSRLNVKASPAELDQLMKLGDLDNDGAIDLAELTKLIEETEAADEKPPDRPRRNPILRLLSGLLDLLNTTWVQAILYFSFVVVFQTLTVSLRAREEYYLDKAFSDTFVDNAFDAALNEFGDIRRVADVWEWGNTVLWPGLLGNQGPSCSFAGKGGVFNSAIDAPPVALPVSGCIDNAWPDGEGSFHTSDATPWSVDELVRRFNQVDWSEGIAIWQSRVRPVADASVCRTRTIGHLCLPEMVGSSFEDSDAFGYNWTHPTSPLTHPFRYYTATEAGFVADGPASANPASLRTYPSGGFAVIVLPFFSDTYLPPEKGTHDAVTDHRPYKASADTPNTPKYFCVRLVWNGDWIHQLCDPNDAQGRITGTVRYAIEEMWNDLKRAHWIDHATRAMTITTHLRSNNAGVRSRVTFMFEFTAAGSVLPSYDVQTRVTRDDFLESTFLYNWIAFAFTAFFCVLEGIEMVSSGLMEYFSDMWNVMDWGNYGIFFAVWYTLLQYQEQLGNVPCAPLCERTGYLDPWQVMMTIRDGKFYLSLCVCIQLLKIIKFTSALVPKMDLAPLVLKKALADLVFFGVVFLISMISFSTMFYIQLGPFLVDYASQEAALIGLGRSLFGDFDIDEILDNSNGYTNTLLFLVYLFVAVFIMLSMFFAILGESQATLRDEQREARRAGTLTPEYGMFQTISDGFTEKVLINMPGIGAKIREDRMALRAAEIDKARATAPTAVDRIERRQLQLADRVDDMADNVQTFTAGLLAVVKSLEDVKSQPVMVSIILRQETAAGGRAHRLQREST